MSALTLGVPADAVKTSVRLDRSLADRAVFEYRLEIAVIVSAEDRRVLEEAARTCPVRKAPSKELEFVQVQDQADLSTNT